MPQFAGALGQRCEHCVSMGNGLIAWQVQAAGQVLRGLNGLFFHDEILARGVTPVRIPRSATKFPFSAFGPVLPASFYRTLPVPRKNWHLIRRTFSRKCP